jgi:hypothetical protein
MNIQESRRTPNPHFFQVLGFTPTLGQSRVATIDDILMYSKATEEHIGHLKYVSKKQKKN